MSFVPISGHWFSTIKAKRISLGFSSTCLETEIKVECYFKQIGWLATAGIQGPVLP